MGSEMCIRDRGGRHCNVVPLLVAVVVVAAAVAVATVLHFGNAHACAGLLGVYFQFGNHSFAQLPFRQTLQNHMTQNL